MQYFCLHGILPFSKSYPEIESTWSTAERKRRMSSDTWYYIAICATLCVSFSPKSKSTNAFLKHILKSKARDQSIEAMKKLFCHVTVNNYLCNALWSFRSKLKACGGTKSKNRQLTLLCRGTTFKSSYRRCSIKKMYSKISQYPQETPVLESLFKKVCKVYIQNLFIVYIQKIFIM